MCPKNKWVDTHYKTFTISEVNFAINKLKLGKASNTDGISPELIKFAGDKFML